MRNSLPVLMFLLITMLLDLACTEEPPLKLTSAQREQLDTLYSEQVIGLALEMDSLCEVFYANSFQETVDSLLGARKAGEQALREKYQKK